MVAQTQTPEDRDVLLSTLSHQQRRYALYCLKASETPLAVADLAADVAALERDTTATEIPYEEAKRVRTSLHHVHIPKLEDADLVRYNADRGTVEISEEREQLERYWEHLPVE